jgi:hypothetical protein
MALPFELVTAIVCDDIRREKSNKDILIGVYGGGILVQDFPAFINIALWLQIRTTEIGEHDLLLRITGPNQSSLSGDIQFKANVVTQGLSSFPFPIIGVSIQSEGPISFQIGNKAGEWATVKSIDVTKGSVVQ